MAGRSRALGHLRVVLVALLALGAPAAAAAGSDADTARAWGLLGTWASDCSAPSSREMRYIYEASGPRVRLYRDGASARDVSPLARVRIRPDGMLAYQVTFGPRGRGVTRVNVLARRPDGRTRMMFNHDLKGRHTVRYGILVETGRETSWDIRCP